MNKTNSDPAKRFTPILFLLFIVMAFVIGALWQKVQVLEKGTGPKLKAVASTSPTPQIPENGKLSEQEAKLLPAVTSTDHVRGATNPQVYLIEYSDYYCPYCSNFHLTAQELLKEYPKEVTWVYRHFPLDQLHKNARPVAEIAECISELSGQEKFWQYSDNLYSVAQPESPEQAIEFAVNLGVDQAALDSCYKELRYKDKVEQMLQSGVKAGVTGTPGNFIVSKSGGVWKLPGAVPINQLKPIIDEALSN